MAFKRTGRIWRLWKRSPCCHWCGEVTVLIFRPGKVFGKRLPKLNPPPFEATIDHLYSRLDPRRGQVNGREVTVLACWKCNNERNAVEERQRPLDELRRRAENGLRRRPKADQGKDVTDETHDL